MIDQALVTSQGDSIDGPILLTPRFFEDERGFFYESWNLTAWHKVLSKNDQKSIPFVQDNHSFSSFGVLRGLHYQIEPRPQGKLVRCVSGEIFDVAVDLRLHSVTFGQWGGAFLSAKNKKQLWIPVGFAHGFLTLSSTADVLYKTTDFWHKESERSICWDDSDLKISWPKIESVDDTSLPCLSGKDELAPCLKDLSKGDFFS